MDIALDPDTGSMVLVNGSPYLLDGIDAIVQHICIRLCLLYGEWHLNTKEGMPYFEKIFKMGAGVKVAEPFFKQCILQTPGVASNRTLNLVHTKASRALSVSFEAVAVDGQIMTVTDFKPFIIYQEAA